MKAANALNLLLAIALVLMSAKLYFTDGPTAIWLSSRLTDSEETPVRDFHAGDSLPEPPAAPPSAPANPADFALAALGVDASALPVPKADAVTTATPSAKKEEAEPKADAVTSATPSATKGEAATAAREFKAFDVKKEFADNPFDIFTGKGMLLCAGDREKSNAMTIGWGGLGTLWGRNDAVTVYVAEKRHTKLFMDKAAYFTVMAFDKEKQANILDYMGRNSGRDGDKAAALGLHIAFTERGTPYYEEAEMVLECEMMYSAPFDPAGMRDVPQKLYANFPAGVHTMYIGRIVQALSRR